MRLTVERADRRKAREDAELEAATRAAAERLSAWIERVLAGSDEEPPDDE